MPVLLTKKFGFEAAHLLPEFPEGHKCRRLHGHSFRIEINVLGEINAQGVLMDFGDIKAQVKPLIDMLDHQYLNELGDISGDPLLKNPTSENLAKWFFDKLEKGLPELHSVVVHETCTTRCEFRKEF
jgi:6-pyruvoyltetrahydropterin/6-carboxytetrahydropterin synthase